MNTFSGTNFQTGVLDVTGTVTVLASNMTYPATAVLDSSAGGRLIEISADGGVIFQTPPVDMAVTAQQIVALKAPLSHVRFTGAAGDVWMLR
jgi:hypothetical protein